MPRFAVSEEVLPNGGEDTSLNVETPHPSCWVFSHLPKSGGTSLKTVMMKKCDYCKSRQYDYNQWCGNERVSHFNSGKEEEEGKSNLVRGGYTEAMRFDSRFDSCAWFTMFRHPIPRLVSAFFYCRKRPIDKTCATRQMPEEAHHDIIAFAKHWGNFAMRQMFMGIVPPEDVVAYVQNNKGPGYKCKKDSGWYWLKLYLNGRSASAFGNHTEEEIMFGRIQQIEDIVSNQFTAVGILEEFNTTLALFNAALRIPGLDWQSSFTSIGIKNADDEYKSEEDELLEKSWSNSELKSYINLDLLLYEHALDVFHQQARFHGVI